ncbi:hypothetical protein FOCC_FOCC013355 [Frankliniella occidentalis]|nr:hypothetical protein FOCC_FOCC013355 [Frankliniella occidentalis]
MGGGDWETAAAKVWFLGAVRMRHSSTTSPTILGDCAVESSVDGQVGQVRPRPYQDIPGPPGLPVIGNTWRFLPIIGKQNHRQSQKLSGFCTGKQIKNTSFAVELGKKGANCEVHSQPVP